MMAVFFPEGDTHLPLQQYSNVFQEDVNYVELVPISQRCHTLLLKESKSCFASKKTM